MTDLGQAIAALESELSEHAPQVLELIRPASEAEIAAAAAALLPMTVPDALTEFWRWCGGAAVDVPSEFDSPDGGLRTGLVPAAQMSDWEDHHSIQDQAVQIARIWEHYGTKATPNAGPMNLVQVATLQHDLVFADITEPSGSCPIWVFNWTDFITWQATASIAEFVQALADSVWITDPTRVEHMFDWVSEFQLAVAHPELFNNGNPAITLQFTSSTGDDSEGHPSWPKHWIPRPMTPRP